MSKLRFLMLLPCVLWLAAMGSAQSTQLDLPLQSQAARVTQTIGITDITINYHRPLVNGRKVWGDLVPYGQVWRAGANLNTTITFANDVTVEGQPLAAGTYGLHMIPNQDAVDDHLFQDAYRLGQLQLQGIRRRAAHQREAASGRVPQCAGLRLRSNSSPIPRS